MDTSSEAIEALAKAYCKKYSSQESANDMSDFEIYERVFALVRDEPSAALYFVQAALLENPNDFAFANLAAGPLEDLLVLHGSEVIEDVELEVKRNVAFDDLLGGVFLGRMTPEVAERVANARSAIWKD